MREYKGEQKSYEEAKLNAILAVLATMDIQIKDEFGLITINKNGSKVATIDISTSLSPNPTEK